MNKKLNVFIEIPVLVKFLIVLYFVVFVLTENLLQLAHEKEPSVAIITIVILNILTGALGIFPFFLRGFGLLHLLIFPDLIGLFKGFAKNPVGFFELSYENGVILNTTSAGYIPPYSLIDLNLQSTFLTFIWIIFVYVGYFYSNPQLSLQLKGIAKTASQKRFYLLSLVAVIVIMVFFYSVGGVTSWISTWGLAGGRDKAAEGLGPIMRLLKVAYFIPLIWYLLKGTKVFRNPVFLLILLLTISVGFFSTGSRSSVITVILAFFVVYMIKTHKIPKVVPVISFFVAVFLFGLLGQIRSESTYNQGRFAWENIEFDIKENIEDAGQEAEAWAGLGTSIAIYDKVPDEIDYLYGKSYVAFIMFWIPRAIWSDKPHSAGYYTGREIFNSGGGVPPPPNAEAFWNFGYLGVIIIAFVQGVLSKLIVNTFRQYYFVPGVVIFYVFILISGFSMSTLVLTALLQSSIFIFLVLKYLRLI